MTALWAVPLAIDLLGLAVVVRALRTVDATTEVLAAESAAWSGVHEQLLGVDRELVALRRDLATLEPGQ